MKEKWRAIKGYKGLYECSNTGLVRSIRNGLILKPNTIAGGYQRVVLCVHGRPEAFLIHRLVAELFVPNPDNLPQVNHKNENKKDNRATNLEWVTPKQNLLHSNVIQKRADAAKKANRKPVLMFKDGKFVKEFDGATSAAKAIGSFQQLVSNCCNGKQKMTRGYSFRFK